MDVERDVRKELISGLGVSFNCAEEIYLASKLGRIRCDVLARPTDPNFSNYLFAFEVKRPKKEWHYAVWARALKQTIDYCGAKVCSSVPNVANADDVVTASFIFPAPFDVPSEQIGNSSEYVRDGFENSIAGMFHLALMFRCGRAGITKIGSKETLSLSLGPTQIWSGATGFFGKSHDFFGEGRPLGSRNRRL